jgi:hypothetical protein
MLNEVKLFFEGFGVNMAPLFGSTSFFYLYVYPIVSSIFAGFIFWFIFSYLPERSRKKNFGIGIADDLIKLNGILFGYFDLFLKDAKHSPSRFQDKIHSCTLEKEEVELLLQNKILNSSYNFYPQISDRLIQVGGEILNARTEIDEVIKRLYSFNLYISPSIIALLRRIHEKVFRYSAESHAVTLIGKIEYRPVDPSLSYMSALLIELQHDYRTLRLAVFEEKIFERDYVIGKIQAHFHSFRYKECIALCSKWISKFPFDAELHMTYTARSLFSLGRNNDGYAMLELLLSRNADLVSHRDFFYSILSDPVAHQILLKRRPLEKVEEMKKISESEAFQEKTLLASNAELKKYYATARI